MTLQTHGSLTESGKELTIALYSENKIPISFYWEVTAYKVRDIIFNLCSDGFFRNENDDYFYRYEPLHARVYSIKRTIDGAIFTLGDKHPEKETYIQGFYLGGMPEIRYDGFCQGIAYCKPSIP